MEFYDPNASRNSDECATRFCSTIAKALTFTANECSDIAMSREILDARTKFMKLRDFISESDITRKIGAIAIAWREPIMAYDDNFFATVDISRVIDMIASHDSAIGQVATKMDAAACARWRERFMRATSKDTRITLLDALNSLLIHYAKHEILIGRE